MNKDINYFGIGISHLVFDVTDSNGNYDPFKNNVSGFKTFVKLLKTYSQCVMEATGYCHYQLAYHLLESGINASVENPLAVKHFIEMKVSKIKTDKSNSKLICAYDELQIVLKFWKVILKMKIACLQITRVPSVYKKQRMNLKNKLHSEAVLGSPSKAVVRSLTRSLKQLQKGIKNVKGQVIDFGKTSTS
jgi:transposase